MGLLSAISGFFGFGEAAVPHRKRLRDAAGTDIAPAKRQRGTNDDDDDEWDQEIEDEYDPTVLSEDDAALLDSLGVLSYAKWQKKIEASSDEKREIWETMNEDDPKVLKKMLRRLNIPHSAKADIEDLRDLLEEQYNKEDEGEDMSLGDLVDIQENFTDGVMDDTEPMPKHVFKSAIGLLNSSKGKNARRVAVAQEACLEDGGKWLKRKGTKDDLKDLEALAQEFRPMSNGPGDRWHLPGGDADGTLIPMLAPLAAPHSNVTQASFSKMEQGEAKKVVLDSLGVGLNLRAWLSNRGKELQVWDHVAEQAVEEMKQWKKVYDTDDIDDAIMYKKEEWEAQLTEVLKPFGEMQHCVASDAMTVRPYFAFGVTKNGNVAGYFSTMVCT